MYQKLSCLFNKNLSRNLKIFFLFFSFSAFFFSFAHAEWKLEKDEAGIKVYLNEVKGSEIKAFKGVTTIKASMDTLLAIVKDTDNFDKWIHQCTEPKVLKAVNFHDTYSRQINDLPWPVDDREVVMFTAISKDSSKERIYISLEARPDYIPKNKDYVRVTKLNGFYLFNALPDGMTEVTWQQHTEPGGSLPVWLINALVVDIPFKSLEAMRTLAQTKEYQKYRIKYSSSGKVLGFQ
jgi:hypothetical protein